MKIYSLIASTILAIVLIAPSHSVYAGSDNQYVSASKSTPVEWRKNRGDYKKDHKARKKKVIKVPGKRKYRNIVVVRPHGHRYYGYGRHYHDDDAWRWLAFTAITLKILDNINEEAQRDHEAAQVRATTAPVGEVIEWMSNNATGSVVATKEGISKESGLTCREFQQTITVGGKTEQAYGTACLQADGAWEIIK